VNVPISALSAVVDVVHAQAVGTYLASFAIRVFLVYGLDMQFAAVALVSEQGFPYVHHTSLLCACRPVKRECSLRRSEHTVDGYRRHQSMPAPSVSAPSIVPYPIITGFFSTIRSERLQSVQRTRAWCSVR